MPENARDAESQREETVEQPSTEVAPPEPVEVAAEAAAGAEAPAEVTAEPAPQPEAAAEAPEPAAAEPAEAPEPAAAEPAEAMDPAEAQAAEAEAPEPAAAEPAEAVEPAAAEPAEAVEPAEAQAAEAEATAGTEPGAAEPTAEPQPAAAEATAGAGEAPVEAEPAAAETAEPTPAETADPAAAVAEPAEAQAAAPATAEKTAEAAETEAKAEPAEPPEPVEESEEVKALRAAQESGQPLEGKVIGWNRGGFHVALDGVTAFCPNSEMELARPRAPETYVDRTLSFRVIKVQRRGRRVVLSRQAILKRQREELLGKLREQQSGGGVLEGTVSSITDFGVFVDLGGVEGLVHVSELSRRRVGHPKNAVELGQTVAVKLLKVEQDGERISLSMKALEPDPWKGVAERFPAGSEFSGKIVRKTDFGLFIELEPEIDGLVHLSRLPPGVELDDKTLEVGQTVGGWVQGVDSKRQRVSLSLRELPKGDPWRGIDERFPEGAVIEGTVESAAPFGVFVNLEPGLTGLLPMSEMSVPRGTHPARLYSPGQKVPVQVVGIDKRRKRISLAREGSRAEGSKADYQAYKKRQQESSGGMNALAAAFAKLKDEGGDDREA